MYGSPLVCGYIEMNGFRGLRVEAHLSGAPRAVPLPASLRVMDSDDGKHWGSKGEPLLLAAGDSALARLRDTRRLVRLEAEVPEGFPFDQLKVRIVREP